MLKRQDEMTSETRDRMRGGKGSVNIRHIFSQEEFDGKCRLFARITLEPGCSIGEHVHDREEEVFYIISGTGTVNDNGKTSVLMPGDAVKTGNGAFHSIENTGTEPLVMLAVILLFE
jgi:mannose-6-phosphate isomerase-like protein (cupin superfamily)